MLKKPVSSSRSPRAKRASTSALVIWSASTTAAASANQRQALDKAPRLAGSIEVRAAAPAEAVVVHVRTVVPAAVALRVGARRHLHRRPSLVQVRDRRDEEELELIRQAGECVVVRATCVQVDIGLQRRADLPRRAQ